MTTEQLEKRVSKFMKKAKTRDLKWIYCYFTELEEFPIISDEYDIEQTDYLKMP